MEKNIDFRSITDKFRTEKEFYKSMDYVVELHNEVMKLLNSDMDEKERVKQCKSLNNEMARINKMSRAFVKEKKEEIKNKKI